MYKTYYFEKQNARPTCSICKKPWERSEEHVGTCYVICTGCHHYIPKKEKFLRFEGSYDEDYYCTFCYYEKIDEMDIPDVKEPEEVRRKQTCPHDPPCSESEGE
jgi:hypothetical protein